MKAKKQHLVAATQQRENGDRVVHIQGTRQELDMLFAALACFLGEDRPGDWELASKIGERGYLIGIHWVNKSAPVGALAPLVKYALDNPLPQVPA